jgi:transposase
MMNDGNTLSILEQTNRELRTQNNELKNKVAELEALVKWYEEQTKLAKRRQFAASSEKTEDAEQLGLFDEAETTADPKAEEKATFEEITYTRKKRVGKRDDDLSKLPLETVEHELPESERVCPECGGALHEMSTQEHCEIEVIPPQFKAVRHVQHIYACRSCERNNDHVPILKAPVPEPVIRGSLASPSAVAHIIVEKYVKAVPLYRQEQSLLRDGICLSRQTMANWITKCAQDWLEPIYALLKERLLQEEVLHADETVVQVLREPGKKANTESYEWLYRTSGCAEHPIVLYEYQPTRSSSHPKRFLEGWKGYLHTDGYQGYHRLDGVTVVGCFAHARRKFDEALKILPAEARPGSAAAKGLNFCNKLFQMEREFVNLSPEERFGQRLERSLPVAEEMLSWAQSFAGTPRSALKKAADYFIGQWPWLKNLYLDGRLELSNNRAERSIKPFVIGRKNWLFSNTPKGARASSVLYSIIQTAIENGLHPFLYLKFLFESAPNSTMSQLPSLLPWYPDVQAACKVFPVERPQPHSEPRATQSNGQLDDKEENP